MSHKTTPRNPVSGRRRRPGLRGGLVAVGLVAVFMPSLGCTGLDGPDPLRVALWAGGSELQVEQQVVDLYQARNPGVRVVLESTPNGYEERLLASIAAQRPPDVFLLDGPDVPTFVERGLAMDLSPYTDALGFDDARVFPEVLRAFRRGAALYAFPKDFTPMVLYANRDVLRRAGVAEPALTGWTWDEFLDATRHVVAASAPTASDGGGPDGGAPVHGVPARDAPLQAAPVHGFDFPRNLYQWVPFVWSAGGDILGEVPGGGVRASGFLDGAGALRAFELLVGMVDEGLAPRPQFLQGGDPAREARFAAGRQAFLLSGHWTLPVFRGMVARDALDVAVVPIPHHPSQPGATSVIYAAAWAVPVNAPNPRRALHLAAFLASGDAQRIRAAAGLAIPSLLDVAEQAAASDDTGVERAFLELTKGARMTWGAYVRDFSRVETMAVDIMDRRLLRGEDLAATAKSVAAAIDAELADAGRR